MSETGNHVGTSVALAQEAVRKGRIARARGVERTCNPYPPPTVISPGGTAEENKIAARLQQSWWIGWDEADRELRNPPPAEDSAA